MVNNSVPAQQPQVVIMQEGKHSGLRKGLDVGDVARFLLLGGASIVNIVYVYWFTKYVWSWKVTGLPAIGSGPTADDSRMVWFCWILVAVFFFNALNTMTTNYQRSVLAWFHTLTGVSVFFTGLFGVVHYYLIKGLVLSGAQVDVVWLSLALGACCTMMGGVATRQVRRYIGSDVGGMQG